MKPPRFQFTTRRLMAVVAIAAVLLAAGLWTLKLVRRTRLYKAQALAHSALEAEIRDWTAEWEASPPSVDRTQMMDFLQRRGEHARQLRTKYEHAARYPWIAVEPDPPVPN